MGFGKDHTAFWNIKELWEVFRPEPYWVWNSSEQALLFRYLIDEHK